MAFPFQTSANLQIRKIIPIQWAQPEEGKQLMSFQDKDLDKAKRLLRKWNKCFIRPLTEKDFELEVEKIIESGIKVKTARICQQ
jgi:hypothetical protein